MLLYVATIVAFLASTAIAVWRLRRGGMRSVVCSVVLVAACYVAMVTQRAMTELTGTVSVLSVDIALLGVGMAGAMRLLTAFDPPPLADDDGEDPRDDAPAPFDPDPDGGIAGTVWAQFDAARSEWESQSRSR